MQLVPLAHVVFGQVLVEPRHALDLPHAGTLPPWPPTRTRRSPPSSRRTPPSGFLRYVRIDTQSDEDSETYPSTAKQLDLLRLLVDELRGDRPRRRGDRRARLRHGDAAGDRRARGADDRVLRARRHGARGERRGRQAAADPLRGRRDRARRLGPGDPAGASRRELEHHVGHELITTDGTTLLGADDKAGIAEIMAAAAYLAAHPEIPHGPVKVAFNPDEEIGRGVIHFPVDTFGAVAAYTVDGSTAGEVQTETFSGAQVRMKIRGRAIHPGWAKGELVNAIKLAADDRRAAAEGRALAGDDRGARGLRPPRRDLGRLVGGRAALHRPRLRERPARRARRVPAQDRRGGRGDRRRAARSRSSRRIQYRNMRDTLEQHPEIVANLEEAVRRVGLEPKRTSIRGGTDGSALTEMGLPTPNIFTGGHDAHSEREWICVEDMGLAAATIVELAKVWAGATPASRGLRCRDGAAARQARPPARDPAHLDHRPLQLPLRLLHAEGGLRPRPRLPRAQGAAELRGDRARRRRLRGARRAHRADHGRRAARAPRTSSTSSSCSPRFPASSSR